MRIIIDRFEGEFAVVELENKQFINMPKQLVPVGAVEGTVLYVLINETETKERKDRSSKLIGNLWKEKSVN